MADKDKTEADPLARWRTIRLTGADILKDMNSLPVDVSKIEFVQATDFDRLAARVQKLEAALAKFKVWGTDGCRGQNDTCQGRITLFITDDRCLECQQDQILKGASE